MPLVQLTVAGIRNLEPATLVPSPCINILYGANGSGKTSLLEAIHLLGLARSFRSHRMSSVITHEQDGCQVFGRIETLIGNDRALVHQVGVGRNRDGELSIRVDGENLHTVSQLADILPVQLINPDSFRLLDGPPKTRRHFLDWGVFHMEHRFIRSWRRFEKALKQRNALLRHGILDTSMVAAWDGELQQAGEEIDQYRQSYVSGLKPLFMEVLEQLMPLPDMSLSYYRGWDRAQPLLDVLQAGLERDRQLGHTQAGPQRGDLRLRLSGSNAADILSRGQQKLVVCALKIAQGFLLNQSKSRQCIYLVDDLASELDQRHRILVCRLLESLQCQIFITGVEREPLLTAWSNGVDMGMFHVEQGKIGPGSGDFVDG